MPRRQFVADLAKAQNDVLPTGISDVKAGDDDGQIEFDFLGHQITALIPELSEYPKSHEYMIFSADDTPRHIAAALENIRGINRKSVFELLDIVSATLLKISPDKDGDSQMHDDGDDLPEEDESDVDIYDSDHEDFEVRQPTHNPAYAAQQPSTSKSRTSDWPFRQRIRADLRAAKEAGFKVGVLGHLLDGYNCYVTLSVRIAKLGISEEAMQAWQVEPTEYLILIIQYPNGYKTNEELQGYESLRLTPNIGFRVVAGKRYKPTLQEAREAFAVARKGDHPRTSTNELPGPEEVDSEESSIRDTFISKPLNDLLRDRLVPVLRFRSAGMGWMGAEDWYRDQMSVSSGTGNAIPDQYFNPERLNDALPDIVHRDHYQAHGITQYSFPLLGMQFLLRHFVRCTEFCLVCHRKLQPDDAGGNVLEAIKPYVCDNGLCLYQFISLGLGPSMEYELVAQPYVVDLLVSFCYNACAAHRLNDFPDGLSLVVPPVDPSAYNFQPDPYGYGARGRGRHDQPPTPQQDNKLSLKSDKYEVGFDVARREIIFYDKSAVCPVRPGMWIVLTTDTIEGYDLHCRVSETTFFPTISVDEPVKIRPQNNSRTQVTGLTDNGQQTPAATRPVSPATSAPVFAPAKFQVYDQDFAGLEKHGKSFAICRLLDTLPDVLQMREYLVRHPQSELKNWTERISSSALSLLRWIIASNRSCIMQVDGDKQSEDQAPKSKSSSAVFGKDQERCYGMSGYMQFRFAMGAPDKEQRFITEVRDTTTRLKLKYPTLFAWHGSPLFNWHSIIRQGLHFKNADHGRAYGDGIYHAKDAHISTGYSAMGGGYGVSGRQSGSWPGSVLGVTGALALNEIVNAPAEFTSQSPYYVVKQLDWVQVRYLFVQVSPSSDRVQVGTEVKPQNPHPQDPALTPKGINSSVIEIPAAAIKSGKTVRVVEAVEAVKKSSKSTNPFKKLKLSGNVAANPVIIDDDDDVASEATDVEDLEVLFDEPKPQPPPAPVPVEKKKNKGPTTDFVPGSLDFSELPLMPLPTYAQSGTTKRLMKELQNLAKVQESSNQAELGWYIDVEKIENVYQWIVELHSFHAFEVKGKPLPLAEDMKQQKVKSIVLEIRFNKDFPFTPPYVRVLRPRFLSFNQGGGGHIVLGGAMCMELLTNTGWSSVSSMESVLMQIRMAIASEPFARLDKAHAGQEYGTGEAADGYLRACATHGWQVPPGFKEMAYGQASSSNGGQ